jgi:hypothetical protein
MEFDLQSPVWFFYEDHWWPCVVVAKSGTSRVLYFYGDGSGCEVDVSNLIPFSTEDPEKMNDPVTAAAVAEIVKLMEKADDEIPEGPKRDKDAERANRKAERAARRERRKREELEADEAEAAENPIDGLDDPVPFDDPAREYPDVPDYEPVPRLHDRRQQPRGPLAYSKSAAITAVEMAVTAPNRELRAALGECRGYYKEHLDSIDFTRHLCRMHEADFIRSIDRQLSSLKAMKKSLEDLRKVKKDKGETAEVESIDDDLASIERKIIAKSLAADVLPMQSTTARPNEKPERKKGKRFGFSDPFVTPQWVQSLPFVPVGGGSLRDLCKPTSDGSSRRAPKVHVMRSWMCIRDRPTFVRPRDTQPVPAEGATSRLFDSVSRKSTILLAEKSATFNRRSSVSLLTGDALWDQREPLQSYFQFSDFAETAVEVASAPTSVVSQNLLTPVFVDSAPERESTVHDEIPEDTLPPPAAVLGDLPSPSAPWVVSELDGTESTAATPVPARVMTADWTERARQLVTYELSKYVHGKCGKEKIVSKDSFGLTARKIFDRIVNAKKEVQLRHAHIDFTQEDQNKIKKEVEKVVKANAATRKRPRVPEEI